MDSCLRRNDGTLSREIKPNARHVLRHVQRSYQGLGIEKIPIVGWHEVLLLSGELEAG